ncbi:MAG: response regulator [Candidatus Ancaeobacter aquaticus]|nr:response regulator [Candidatus Ancaeobacter aquaticus]
MTDTNKTRILVVDDNVEQVTILEKIFTKDGYQVDISSNGFDALQIVMREDIDIVITDMSMPGMNGLKLLRQVKEKKPEVQVIIITAFGEWGAYAEALKEGAYEFVSKPFKVEEIIKLVKTIEKKIQKNS